MISVFVKNWNIHHPSEADSLIWNFLGIHDTIEHWMREREGIIRTVGSSHCDAPNCGDVCSGLHGKRKESDEQQKYFPQNEKESWLKTWWIKRKGCCKIEILSLTHIFNTWFLLLSYSTFIRERLLSLTSLLT